MKDLLKGFGIGVVAISLALSVFYCIQDDTPIREVAVINTDDCSHQAGDTLNIWIESVVEAHANTFNPSYIIYNDTDTGFNYDTIYGHYRTVQRIGDLMEFGEGCLEYHFIVIDNNGVAGLQLILD